MVAELVTGSHMRLCLHRDANSFEESLEDDCDSFGFLRMALILLISALNDEKNMVIKFVPETL